MAHPMENVAVPLVQGGEYPDEMLRDAGVKATVRFSVPLLPASVNHYKIPNGRGGWFKTKASQAFTDAVCIFGRPQRNAGVFAAEFYEVDLVFAVEEKHFLRCDSDNFEKLAFDGLKAAGIIRDDRYIVFHSNRKIPVATRNEERTEYVVTGVSR
jgi:Holliday junction resolvase RusA-like endonuclease